MRSREKQVTIVIAIVIACCFGGGMLNHDLYALDTTGWTKFSKEECEFEFMYPPGWRIDDVFCPGIDPNRGAGLAIIKEDVPLKIGINRIPINEPRATLTLKEHIVRYVSQLCIEHMEGYTRKRLLDTIEWKPIVIGGIEGMQAVKSGNKCIQSILPWSVVKKDGFLYIFQMVSEKDISLFTATYSSLIATFKFTK